MRSMHKMASLLAFLSFGFTLFSQDQKLSKQQFLEQGNSHFDQQVYPEAAAAYRMVIALDSSFLDAWYNLALTYYLIKDYRETERCVDQVFSINPEYEGAYGLYGMALYHQHKYQRAIEAFGFAIATDPVDDLLLARAFCYLNDGSPKFSLPDFDEVLYRKPGHIKACQGKGAALMELEKHEYAIRYFNRILDLFPDHIAALTNRAICYFKTNRLEKAYQDFEMAITLGGSVETYLARAKCAKESGNFQLAIQSVKSALRLHPKHPEVYLVLGETEIGMDKYQEAIQSFTIALDLDHTCLDCYLMRGEAQAKTNNFIFAIEDCYAALEIAPDNQPAKDLLQWVYWKMDRARNGSSTGE